MEAFSDGVVAIIITIMVLEMNVPQQTYLAALKPALPFFLSYVLSYLYVGADLVDSGPAHRTDCCQT